MKPDEFWASIMTLAVLVVVIFLLMLSPAQAESIPKDKKLHAAAGFVVTVGTRIVLEATVPEWKPWVKTTVSIGAGVLAGVIKEGYDNQISSHVCETQDAAWTAYGAAAALPLITIIW